MRSVLLVTACLGIALSALAQAPLRTSPTELVRAAEAKRPPAEANLDADSLHSYDQIALAIDYRVEDSPAEPTGWVYLTLIPREDLAVIPFNAEGLTIHAVNYQDAALPFTHENDTLFVEYAVTANDTLTLEFQVTVPVVEGAWNGGYHVENTHAFTFAEPYGARRWFPCWDQPYDKLNEVHLTLDMPDYWAMAGNGTLIETTFPTTGRKREVYHHAFPITTYLVMIAAGEYARYYETVDDVEYRYIALRPDSADAVNDWERTPQMVEFFEQSFGDYPFEEYGMVQAAILGGWGAMEHQTMTTMGHNLVNGQGSYEPIVAHELAHQWFGDALSPVDFRNIWLNEGFATYSTALFYEHDQGQAVLRQIMQQDAQAYFSEDQQIRYTMYDPPAEYLFGNVEYQKGGWVLHMLREQLLGDSLFFVVLRNYVAEHRYGTVDTEDFIAMVNNVAGEDLRWFFDQWVYGQGHPEIYIRVERGVPTAEDVTVTAVQVQNNAPIFRFPLMVSVTTAEGTLVHPFWFTSENQAVTLSFGDSVRSAALAAYQPLLFERSNIPVDAGEPPVIANRFDLGAVYPNPFNALARIPFELDQAKDIRLDVFDVTARLVTTLAQGHYGAGRHELSFNPGPQVASGIYWIALTAGAERRQVKAVLLR